MWFESTVAPPWHFQIAAAETLIPADTFERADIVLFVDQIGYRLPVVQWNEMDGDWQVDIAMTDPMMAALRTASRMVLQVGSQTAWDMPTVGLGPALEQAQQFCAATWVATGFGPPPGFGQVTAPPPPAFAAPPVSPQGVFQLPAQIQSFADKQCEGQALVASAALQAGDLDGDSQPDVVMNWRDVTCAGQTMNMFCGAANCSIDVFMSSRGYVNPVQMLGTSADIGVHPTGRLALSVSGTWGLCGETGCDAPWLWNGSDLVQVP
jgi:hypothetical protein